MKNFKSFISDVLIEANIATKIKRDDLNLGDRVMTTGTEDNINIDYKSGKIIKIEDYGKILIEFDNPFDKKLHAGFNNVGKPGHCLYVSLKNIKSNDPGEFEKIIKRIKDEEKNRDKRLKENYKTGDVIVGIGKFEYDRGYGGYRNNNDLDIDGEVGLVFYEYGNAKEPKLYWVGFLNKFSDRLRSDNDNMPKNKAGFIVDKLHMRPIEKDEIDENLKKEIEKAKKETDSLGETYELNDIVVCDGKTNGIDFKNRIGIIREVINNQGRAWKRYTIQFLEMFNDGLYNVNNMMSDNIGYQLTQSMVRRATEEEIAKSKDLIDKAMEEIKSYNYDYKVGDYVINVDGQIGMIYQINGTKPRDNFRIESINCFYGKYNNNYTLNRSSISLIDGGEEIKRKLENKEILPFMASNTLLMLLNRSKIRVKLAFTNMSYFDITDNSSSISYIALDKFKRLEGKEYPYKSRFRQQMKIGKFFRVINDKLTDKEVETNINVFRSNYDIYITGLADKLKLVSGEDIRFWYNGNNYVKGGGSLNGSCMQDSNKGREMQMFVDNPDTIQMLTLMDDKTKKLLGRALVWRLVVPSGGTFMDYIYTRYDKDIELFKMYADQNGWFSYELKNVPKDGVICALNTDKKYSMGRDALDHFDSFSLYNGNLLSNSSIARDFKNPYLENKPKPEPNFKININDEVTYKKDRSAHDNKNGKILEIRDDDKIIILFNDGKKFAASAKYVYPKEKK